MKVKIPCMNTDFYLEIEDYRNANSSTGRKLRVWNVHPDGRKSDSHYIPLEVLPDYVKAITALLEKEK